MTALVKLPKITFFLLMHRYTEEDQFHANRNPKTIHMLKDVLAAKVLFYFVF